MSYFCTRFSSEMARIKEFAQRIKLARISFSPMKISRISIGVRRKLE